MKTDSPIITVPATIPKSHQLVGAWTSNATTGDVGTGVDVSAGVGVGIDVGVSVSVGTGAAVGLGCYPIFLKSVAS
jgi:hypothetical protein